MLFNKYIFGVRKWNFLTEREKKSAALLATPKKVERTRVNVTHSPKTTNERLSNHYRLKSEQFAPNCVKAGDICRIAGNRDRYLSVDLARNFSQILKQLA